MRRGVYTFIHLEYLSPRTVLKMHWLLFPLSAVSMLGLLFIMLVMDTAMQETPPTYYVRRQMPVAEPVAEPVEPEEPEEPVAGYGEDFGEALEEEFDDEPQEPPDTV